MVPGYKSACFLLSLLGVLSTASAGKYFLYCATSLTDNDAATLFFLVHKFASNPVTNQVASVFANSIRHALISVVAVTLVFNILIVILILLRIQQAERLASTRDGTVLI